METDSHPMDTPIICESCQTAFSIEALSSEDYKRLQTLHYDSLYYGDLETELKMLLRVQDLLQRRPEVELLWESNLRKRRFEYVEPTYDAALLANYEEKDKDVLEYLRSNFFQLEGRMAWVKEMLSKRQFIEPVLCPNCKSGHLKMDAEKWIDPNAPLWTT